MSNKQQYTSATQANTYETTMPLLGSMAIEFKELSKKKPEAAISKTKIKIVNRLLEKVREVLADQETIVFLDLLDEDEVPQASDVTLVLSQYVAAMNAFNTKYYGYRSGEGNIWFIDN